MAPHLVREIVNFFFRRECVILLFMMHVEPRKVKLKIKVISFQSFKSERVKRMRSFNFKH